MCIVVPAVNALYTTLVAIGNITDYNINFDFFQHVLAMDSTDFRAGAGVDLDPEVIWRSIPSPPLQTTAYIMIIGWEVVTAAVLLLASARWLTIGRRPDDAAAYRLSSVWGS